MSMNWIAIRDSPYGRVAATPRKGAGKGAPTSLEVGPLAGARVENVSKWILESDYEFALIGDPPGGRVAAHRGAATPMPWSRRWS